MKKILLSVLLVGIFAFPCLAIEAKTGGGGSSSSGISNVVEDTTPELGGALEGGNFGVNTSSKVTSAGVIINSALSANGDVAIASTTASSMTITVATSTFVLGKGSIFYNGIDYAPGAGSGDAVLAGTQAWTGQNTFTSQSSFTALVSGATTAIFSRIGVGAVDGNPLANIHISTNQSQGMRIDYTGSSGNGAATVFLAQSNGSAGAVNDIFGSYGFYSTTGAATNGVIQIGGAIRAAGAGTWNNGSAPTDVTISNVPSGSLVLTERMRVRSTGNVGIGTNAPATKVDVFNGSVTIRGTSAGLAITQDAGQKLEALIAVTTGTTRIVEVNSSSVVLRISLYQDQLPADYVFSSGYNLLPLEAVESHIKQYGHLPTYSSGADISGGKVSSGEFNRQTQETVETLFLYLKEANAEIKMLKKEIELLKRK